MRTLPPGASPGRDDERAIEEICFKLDGRLTMAIEDGQLLPHSTPEGMRRIGTPERFCELFADSTWTADPLGKLPELSEDVEPTVPPTPPPEPSQLAVHWATGLKGFHGACVKFLTGFQANVSDTIQLVMRRYNTAEGGRQRIIRMSQAFPWSDDFKGFKTCQEDLSEALNQRGSVALPSDFRDKDWSGRLCLDVALGYMSTKSTALEPPKGLEAQAFPLSGATPNIFCRSYETQFGPPGAPAPGAPPEASLGAAGENAWMNQTNATEKGAKVNATEEGVKGATGEEGVEGHIRADGSDKRSPSTGPTKEGGLAGQMSGNEGPP